MDKIVRFITAICGLLYAAFGGSPTRKVDRAELERTVGRKVTAVVMAIPVVTVVVWLAVWAGGRIFGSEGAEDPFAWMRTLLPSSEK